MVKDLRDYLSEVEEAGELEVVKGADWRDEIGAITELVAEKGGGLGGQALLFDDVVDYPQGFRVLSNTFGSVERSRIALNRDKDTSPLEIVDWWRKRMEEEAYVGHEPELVDDAKFTDNIDTGSDIDVTKFPVPVWHEQDEGERYIGTGCTVLTKDPDTGWVNLGVYRSSIIDEDTVSMAIWPGKDGLVTMRKYHERDEDCPIVMVAGLDPYTWIASTITAKRQESEYEIASWLQGEPLPVVEGKATDIPIPATAEIVIEGHLPPLEKESCTDGPFGEWPGYSTPPHPDLPVLNVDTVMYRDNPILLGQPPLRPPAVYTLGVPIRTASGVWNQLENAGVPAVKGVWTHVIERPMFMAVAIDQEYAGHSKQAGFAAMSVPNGSYGGRYVVVVDSDVDITDLEQVIWAMCTRCRAEDIEVINGVYTSPLDPVVEDRQNPVSGRVIIDATRPYDGDFPETIQFNDEFREQVRTKWNIDEMSI